MTAPEPPIPLARWGDAALEQVCRTEIPGYDPWATALPGQRFEVALARRAIAFFHDMLVFVEGERAGEPFDLEPWQAAIVGNLFGWVDGTSGHRRYREGFVFVARKNGKALALNTPIPTPAGWTTMGGVKVGDAIFDEQGRACRVTFVTPVMHGRPCYRVRFSDGTSIVADAEHLWTTEARKPRSTAVRTTREIADTLRVTCPRAPERVEWNHTIPVAGALRTEPVGLPIPPYTLGYWLGNGTTADASVTLDERDVAALAEIRAEGEAVGGVAWKKGHAIGVRLTDGVRRGGSDARLATLNARLRGLGVLGRKHIPPVYLRASVQQRKALLCGLMDSDGSASKAGQCEFSTMTLALRDGVIELLRSLGYKPTCLERRAKLRGRDCGPYWRIQFWAYRDQPCFRLGRKIERLKPRPTHRTRSMTRQIIAVDPVPSVPVRCIQVDSPSRLYLAGRGMVATHNTAICAGIALYLLLCDGEPGAQVYSAAAEQAQAALIFRCAMQMIARQKELLARTRVYRAFKSIEVPETGSIFRALTADAQTKHGLSVHGAVIDELHAHPTRDLVDVLQTATGARRQPLTVHITTSDYERVSICNEKYEYAKKVRERAIADASFLPVVYEASPQDDWADPAVWRKANPNLGVSVKQEYLERECARAKESPAYLNTFLRLHLNIRTNADVAAFDMRQWEACRGERSYHELAAQLEGHECYAGLDLASTEDLTALVLVFPDDGNAVLPFFWCPKEGAVAREKRHRVPYLGWARDGFLQLTDGNATDFDHVEKKAVELAKRYRIKSLGFDRFGAAQVVNHLQDAGIDVVLFGQGFVSMNGPSKYLDVLVRSGDLRHGGHPVLSWMASNLMWEKDAADNWKPSKRKSREKIDGMTALIMALGMGMALSGGQGPSIEDALLSGDGVLA